MKVYILWTYDSEPEAVFSSKEAAEKYMEEGGYADYWMVTEYEVLDDTKDTSQT